MLPGLQTVRRKAMSEKFNYSYSSARNEEAERIASKYINVDVRGDADLERLRALDKRAEFPGTMAGIFLGLAGVLILGLGMSLILRSDHFAIGVVTGVIGLAAAGLAAPVSLAVTRRNREKIKDEVLALTEKIKHGG